MFASLVLTILHSEPQQTHIKQNQVSDCVQHVCHKDVLTHRGKQHQQFGFGLTKSITFVFLHLLFIFFTKNKVVSSLQQDARHRNTSEVDRRLNGTNDLIRGFNFVYTSSLYTLFLIQLTLNLVTNN